MKMPNFSFKRYEGQMLGRIYSSYKDDIGTGDITAAILPSTRIKAVVKAEESGILAGVLEARFLLSKLGISRRQIAKEGSRIKKGDIILEMHGNARKILSAERTVLNFLTRLSGIATFTHRLAQRTGAKIAATRKTCIPYGDKRAVQVGGGISHRLNLSDMYLIKENHIDIVSQELNCTRIKAIGECIRRAREQRKGKLIEIEVKSIAEALAAAEEKPDIIMADGVGVSNFRKIARLLKGTNILLEASGGITPSSISRFKGADIISLGCITNSCKPLDMSLEVLK